MARRKEMKNPRKGSKLYAIYSSMKARCLNKKHKQYKHYGKRGISICSEWLDSFDTFCDWAKSNGYKEGLSIERKNVNGNYCPENCIFIPWNEQQKNRRNVTFVEYENKKINVNELSKKVGLPEGIILKRLQRGWHLEDAIKIKPLGNSKKETLKITYQGKTKSILGWCKELNIGESTIRRRIKAGKSIEEILKPTNKIYDRYKDKR